MLTPTAHEKTEWSRFAQAAYAASMNSLGHMASAAASLPRDGRMSAAHFDALMDRYRAWLVFGELA